MNEMRSIAGIIFCVFFIGFAVSAQPVNQIKSALSEGNAEQLGEYFSPELEICINRERSMLSKSNAIAKMRSFFSKNKPVSFSNVHKGSSSSNFTGYFTGDLLTDAGEYRVFIYFEESGDHKNIKEVRMDQK